MTCPALVPLALCAALGGAPELMAASLPPSPAATAPVARSLPVSLRRHHQRARYYYRRHRAPRVIVREIVTPAPAVACDPLPVPRPVPTEIIRSPTAIVRAGFDALRGAP